MVAYDPRGRRRTVITLATGSKVIPFAVKCYRPGCRRQKRGYVTAEGWGGGAFYDKRGALLADLREREFACREHGVADGSAPFLVPDPEPGDPPRSTVVDFGTRRRRPARLDKTAPLHLPCVEQRGPNDFVITRGGGHRPWTLSQKEAQALASKLARLLWKRAPARARGGQ